MIDKAIVVAYLWLVLVGIVASIWVMVRDEFAVGLLLLIFNVVLGGILIRDMWGVWRDSSGPNDP